MKPDIVIVFGAGVFCGLLIAIVFDYFDRKRQRRNIEQSIEEARNDRRDPADWWKHGGDPYESLYGTEDD